MHAMEWIPVDQGMPKEHESLFAKFKRQYPEHTVMFEKISDKVLVTVEDIATGQRYVDVMCTHDGKWHWTGLTESMLMRLRVVAWSDYPESYKGGKRKDAERED